MVSITNSNVNFAFIRYPRFKELHEEIKRCQELSKISLEPQCMSLEGESGTGKSTLIKDYARMFPRYETETGTIIPVFYAEIPSPATVKSTVSALLDQLGDPGAGKGTLWAMNIRLIGLIKERGVQLVILDEFSNLFDSGTNHILTTVSDWMKMFIKQTNIPFVVCGISGIVSRILSSNSQLSRLFAFREELLPFELNDEKSYKDFSMFVQYAEKSIELPITNEVPRVEMLIRIHYATNGVVGNIMNLLRYARLIAAERNGASIELCDLALAFDNRLSKHLGTKVNPFRTGADEEFNAPEENDGAFVKIKYTIGNSISTK